MESKALLRLKAVQDQNAEKGWLNRDLYRLMYLEDLYIAAYERIKSGPGAMTPGSDQQTLDSVSRSMILQIIEQMRDESFQFEPARRVKVSKPDGRTRELRIPSVRDKVVHEVMRMILEAIYDSPKGPYFLDSSHGFRRNRGCHTALKRVRTEWSAVNWIIEGDIDSCFDSIDRAVLVGILRKKIRDERFMSLIWKTLSAGYLDSLRTKRDSLAGTPQASIVSPILVNIYLHELDVKIEEVRERWEKRNRRKLNPVYQDLYIRKRQLLRASGGVSTDDVKTLQKRMREIPSVVEDDPDFCRVKYLRYADDWIVGVSGPKLTAEAIEQELKQFLATELKLTLNKEKTRVTHARSEETLFLGTLIRIGRGDGHAYLADREYDGGREARTRSAGWKPVLRAPVDQLLAKLSREGFCDAKGFPLAKKPWSLLRPEQIVTMFSSINRGIQTYYRFTDNFGELRRVQYILKFSMAKTLGLKYKVSVRKVFRSHGYTNFTVTVRDQDGNARKVAFYENKDWSRKPFAFWAHEQEVDSVRTWWNLLSRPKLGKPCVMCGKTDDIEAHRVRYVRRIGARESTGFARLMATPNPKQIPVCRDCHSEVHSGRYDGRRLSDLEYDPR